MKNMRAVTAHIQLLFSWMILWLATLSLSLVPCSADFFGLSLSHKSAMGEQYETTDNFFVFGSMVIAEIGVFLTLFTIAVIFFFTCKKIPTKHRVVHLLADPVLITLLTVPLMLIKGLPTAHRLQQCLTAAADIYHNNTASYNNGSYRPLPCQTVEATAIWHDSITDWRSFQKSHQLASWEMCLQGSVMIPNILRLFHYRWRMSHQAFLHSTIYLMLQAFDISTIISLSVKLHNSKLHLAAESSLYISTFYLLISCLTLATPPVYMGNVITGQYLMTLMLLGTFLIDFPASLIKASIIYFEETSACNYPQTILYVTFIKNVMIVVYVVFGKIIVMLDDRLRYDAISDTPLIDTSDTRDLYYDEEDCV